MKKRKIELVPDWKNAWKWFSMHCLVTGVAVQGAWLYVVRTMGDKILSQELSDRIAIITITLLSIGIFGRLIKQGQE